MESGKQFSLNSIQLADFSDLGETLVLTSSKGTKSIKINTNTQGQAENVNLSTDFNFQGIRSFTITAADGKLSCVGVDNVSLTYSSLPELAQVTNVTLSSLGEAELSDVNNEAGYEVQLYKNGYPQGSPVSKNVDELKHNFFQDMRTAG